MDAELLKYSMEGFGTDERLLTEIVCTRSNNDLKAANAVFIRLNGRSVANWVAADTSGRFQRFLIRCLQADCNEFLVDKPHAELQAKQVHDAITGGGVCGAWVPQ